MKAATAILSLLVLGAAGTTLANTYGSVEPVANGDVVDTSRLRRQPMATREAFAARLLECGIVQRVEDALTSTRAISTINNLNAHFEVGAGGFAGQTNPAYVYTVIDNGPNSASNADIKVLTDGLGYVLSQGSAFLLDADDSSMFDFPANYVVVNFPSPPTIRRSAAFFAAVGAIDPQLFETDTSGYTQYGRAYLSLQSDVPDSEFITGYSQAAAQAGLEYTPIVSGQPALFQGGAAFPGNDWSVNKQGEDYLARIPEASHTALARIRAFHLRFTRAVLARLAQGNTSPRVMRVFLSRLECN